MPTENDTISEEKTPMVSPGNYSPVTVYMKDSLGAVFLGVLTIVLLIGWRRTETKYRALLAKQEVTDGNDSPDPG